MTNKINIRNILSVYSRWLFYIKACRVDKKIVVIESDDWGSIRTSSKESYNTLLKNGFKLNNSPYSKDALETNKDLEELYNVLLKFKGSDNNPPVFTANIIMANPDFLKIKEDDFNNYYYENVSETCNTYESSNKVITLWKDGLNNRSFVPQLHAREHVKYWTWLEDLKNLKNEATCTFDLKMCGLPSKVSPTKTSYYNPPYVSSKEIEKYKINLNVLVGEGISLFEDIFGYKSDTVIAPNCTWTDEIEKIWEKNHIKFIQGGYLQENFDKNVKHIPHFLGQKSKTTNMHYLVRNCSFEPSYTNNPDQWKKTLKQVDNALKNKFPAIISSHRVNYVGRIDSKNRENGLTQLSKLLNAILKKHPDSIFLDSSTFANNYLKN
tara:strand:+ start:14395 stop:15534 length:1140 start_codon:yes stop_codon:yes gene_type:complete